MNTLCGQNVEFVEAFAKLQKATFSFVMSVRPSVRMELGSRCTDFGEISHFRLFRESFDSIKIN
jgi:hypothetical protein